MSIVEKLHVILNNVKGFSTGYSDSIKDKMIVQYDKELYLTKFEKIEVSEEDLHKDDYKNLDRDFAKLAIAVNEYLAKGRE